MTDHSTTPTRLVWLDLETTGLDPAHGSILEIGIVVTDLELNEIDRRAWILPYVRDSIIASMDDYVLNMHMANGLLKEVWGEPSIRETSLQLQQRLAKERSEIGRSVAQWIKAISGDSSSKSARYLAGSSIHFDRAWLAVHFPGILETVSYRMLDVSTFKVAFPGLLSQREGGPAHRALGDLDYSIDQLQQMREKAGL